MAPYLKNAYLAYRHTKESLIHSKGEETVKRIEAIVGTGDLVGIREALREIGVRTVRVTESDDEKVPVLVSVSSRRGGTGSELPAKSKVSVVVSDDLADRVILMLLANAKEGEVDDGDGFASSIEHVVRLEAEGFFEDVI